MELRKKVDGITAKAVQMVKVFPACTAEITKAAKEITARLRDQFGALALANMLDHYEGMTVRFHNDIWPEEPSKDRKAIEAMAIWYLWSGEDRVHQS